MAEGVGLSVVVPLFNEEESVSLLVRSVREALGSETEWELILIDDGSTDGTVDVVEEIAEFDPRVRLIRLARNYGQTAAMQAGFDHARGPVVVSMDGDLQNDPRDIPRLVGKLQEGHDLVVGYREERKDTLLTRKIPSRVANVMIRWITGIEIRDNGCSLKAFRRELLDRIRLYSDLHRFIPAVAAGMAGARITEVPVRHHVRRFGSSKYGLSRVFKVLGDLFVVQMIRFFRDRPLMMFSFAACVAGAIGSVFGVGAAITMVDPGPEQTASIVLPSAALLWLGLGCYLFMLGLLGEVAVRKVLERDLVRGRHNGSEVLP